MARRGGEAMAKRARELRRQQQKEDKKERREAAAADQSVGLSPADENALLEEFASLSERFEADRVSQAKYEEERHRIFVALGIESDDEA